MSVLKAHIVGALEEAKRCYLKDFAALSHDVLAKSPGGAARSGYDFTYEVCVVNDRFAKIVAGENPGEWPFEGWVTCPAEKQNKDVLAAELTAATDRFIAAIDAASEESLLAPTESMGQPSSNSKLAFRMAVHMMYHTGQLNYLQSMNGDDNMHWMD